MTDDQNPTRPTPHGYPDRRYVDRSEPIKPDELARLVDEFKARERPEKAKRPRRRPPEE